MIELDYATVRPWVFPDLLARHHFTGRFDQSLEYLEGLLLKPNPAPPPSPFPPLEIDFKRSKPQAWDRLATPPGINLRVHRSIPSSFGAWRRVYHNIDAWRRQTKFSTSGG